MNLKIVNNVFLKELAIKNIIPISKPIIGEAEKQAVMEVLDSGIVAQGPMVKRLEDEFADFCGTKYAVALNSGTAALHTALHAAGVGEGDSVITSPFSFVASVNPILMQGAKPKFVDIEESTFNINTELLDEAYDESVKAVLPVDLYGQTADYDQITDFANERELIVIEDACQAIGAEYKDQKAGALGHIACFSLYATKNIMSGEGGMLTTNNQDYANEAKSFRQHGMDMNGRYEYSQLGYNYRTTDILAAIALAQLEKTDELNAARQVNAEKLKLGLKDIPGLIAPTVKETNKSVFHQFTVRITSDFGISRDEFIEKMKANGIGAGVYYPRPLHLYPHIRKFGYKEGDFPVAEKASREVVSLPVHPGLTDEQINHIIKSVRELANV